jgi:hypothetical protein
MFALMASFARHTTAVQVSAGENARGRVLGALAGVASVAFGVGIIVSGALGEALGIAAVIATQRAGNVVCNAIREDAGTGRQISVC